MKKEPKIIVDPDGTKWEQTELFGERPGKVGKFIVKWERNQRIEIFEPSVHIENGETLHVHDGIYWVS